MTKRCLKKIPTSSALNFCRRPASKSCGKNVEQNSPSITLPADNLKTISKTTVPVISLHHHLPNVQALPSKPFHLSFGSPTETCFFNCRFSRSKSATWPNFGQPERLHKNVSFNEEEWRNMRATRNFGI